MILISSIKKSFDCVIKNPAITLFLVLFLIVLSILAKYIIAAKTIAIAITLFLCFLALVFAYFSGWFKVIKESCDKEKIKEKNFYMIFLEGIGENIIPTALGLIIYSALMIFVVYLSQLVAFKVFGSISFFLDGLNKVTSENGNLIEYFNSLDDNQQYIIYGWNICIMVSVAIFNFVSMFYFPAILDTKNNQFIKPFSAILKSLKFLFKNFFGAVALSILIYILNMIIAYLNTIFAQNVILSTLLLLVNIYFVSWAIMLIFNYYEAKNNCSNGSDCVRENEDCDTAGEEN